MAPSSSPAPSDDGGGDDDTDDELPTSSVAELTVGERPAPSGESAGSRDPNDGSPSPSPPSLPSRAPPSSSSSSSRPSSSAADRSHRLRTHARLRSYESKRRTAYESKLQSSSLYWRAFRTLVRDGLLEARRADAWAKGWTKAAEGYSSAMKSVGEWCIDEKGAPITDPKKKRRHLEQRERAHSGDHISHPPGGGGAGGTFAGGAFGSSDGGSGNGGAAGSNAEFYREETCGALVEGLAEAASDVAERHDEMIRFMSGEVLPELAALLSETTQEVVFMEKLGDSIIAEMEAAEDEVCRAWESYYRRALDFFGSSSEEEAVPPPERGGGTPDLAAAAAPKGCPDVWVEEMRYRMAVAFLSAVWEKCSSELSKLFLSTKDAECNRRGTLKELLIKAVRRQERLWTGLPTTIAPTLGELIAWPMERKAVEDDVQSSIRERAQAVQLDEAERTRPEDEAAASRPGPGLADAPEDGGDFELSSPLVSDLLVKARVVEKRGGGIMSGWKVGLAIVTSDAYLHLFELPQGCKLAAGSAPEVAFQNLIPPVIVPSMEGVKGGAKFPSARHWFDHLVPSESFALPNCAVTLTDGDAKNPTSFEVVETTEASGASKMFAKTVNRKVQFRAVTREEARDFVDTLEKSK